MKTQNTKFKNDQVVKFNNNQTRILSHGKITAIEFDEEIKKIKYWINGEGWYFENQILGKSEFEIETEKDEFDCEFTDSPY